MFVWDDDLAVGKTAVLPERPAVLDEITSGSFKPTPAIPLLTIKGYANGSPIIRRAVFENAFITKEMF